MKYALVTGGSRGIGRAICIEMARLGYPVIINYLSNEDAALETKAEVEKIGGTAEILRLDVANVADVDNAMVTWQEKHTEDYMAVLVNNAGYRDDAVMVFMKDNQWEDLLKTHLNGFFYVTRRVLKDMLTKRFGRIITVTSLSGIKGLPGQTNYSAAKAGLIGATKSLAQEVGKRGVTVNAVAPGFIATDMTQDLDEKALKEMIPVNRFGTAEEVAKLVSFLASDNSAYITGEVISINGGLYT